MKSPLVVLVTITSLSLGIGASTSVFTIINAFLFQESQGLRDPEGLVAIYTSADHGGLYGESSFPDYLTLHEESETLEDLVAFRAGFLTFDPPADAPEAPADRLIVEIVTGNYFDVMGIRLPLGRGFSPEETELGQAEDLIVLSHEAWMDRFGGDPGILGRALHLDHREFTVIGVGPPGLVSRLLRLKVSGWVPFGTPTGIWHATPEELASRRDHDCIIMARLKEGTPIDAVRSELGLIATRLTEEYPEAWTDNRGEPRAFTVVTERESRLPPDGRQALAGLGATLMGGAFLILLIACSNVAGLFLARAEKRRREMAIRLSMGASRRRLAGMLLTESLLLGLLGGAGGLAIAWWFAEFMAAIPLPLDVPLAFDVGLDARVVGFTALVAVGAAVLFGILPAVRGSRPDLVPALKSDQAVAGKRPGRFGLRNLLVLGQVTASLVLLVGAGLFLRTLQSSASLDVGFNPDRVAILWKELEPEHRTPEGAAQYVQEIEARLEAFPEVEDAEVARRADASVLDLADRAILEIAGYQSADGRPIVQSYTSVSPGFAEMMELPVLRGRTFTEGDGPGAPGVAMVNEAFVRRYWPDSDGLGERFTMLERREVDTPTAAPPTGFEVVGIIRDQPPAFPGARTGPFVWIPYLQDYSSRAIIHLKGRTSAAEMVPILRKEVPLRLGEVPLIPAQTYREALRGRFLGQEIAAKLLAWAGLFALGLAVIGIFGIVSFAVGRRVREMAIRQAVGADRGQILGSLVWEGMFLTVVGLVLGLALAVPLAMTLRGLLFGIGPLDPLAVGAGAGLLLAAAFVACLIPAMRVMGIDPMEVLREE
jgi:predicted permease